jgi:hypothetical protein
MLQFGITLTTIMLPFRGKPLAGMVVDSYAPLHPPWYKYHALALASPFRTLLFFTVIMKFSTGTVLLGYALLAPIFKKTLAFPAPLNTRGETITLPIQRVQPSRTDVHPQLVSDSSH